MNRVFKVLTVLTLCSVLGAAAQEQKRRERKEQFISQRILEKLALSDEQTMQVTELRVQFAKERDAWMQAHKDERDALRAERESARTAGDKTKASEVYQKWNELFAPFHQLREQYREKLRALLTDEQKAKLDQALKEAKERVAARRAEQRQQTAGKKKLPLEPEHEMSEHEEDDDKD
jgi:Spy/CpxP family protein refolding chaperone